MANFKRSPLLHIPDNAITDIRKMYNLDKTERLEEAIDILSEWVTKQAHFLKKDFSKEYLERTLIQMKGSVERAKHQLDSLATMRTLLPKFFTLTHADELGSDLTNVLQFMSLVFLPDLTPDLHRVAIIKLLQKHNDSEMFLLFYRLVIVIVEYVKAFDYVNGYIIVFDYQDSSVLDVTTKMKMIEFHQLLTILLNCYGVRVKAVFNVTESKAIGTLLKLIKPALSEKIYNRLKIIPKGEDLRNFIPEEILPIEYGGKAQSLNTLWDEWVKEVSKPEHQDYMKMMIKAGTDENLRATCKFNNEVLGMPGSFRHLSLD